MIRLNVAEFLAIQFGYNQQTIEIRLDANITFNLKYFNSEDSNIADTAVIDFLNCRIITTNPLIRGDSLQDRDLDDLEDDL